jgi:hypothetical protein
MLDVLERDVARLPELLRAGADDARAGSTTAPARDPEPGFAATEDDARAAARRQPVQLGLF